MPRYIDAEKLCFEILEEYGISTGGDDVTEIYGMIINQPTADVVEVVRCKDCKYGHLRDNTKRNSSIYCDFGIGVHKENYCSFGERTDT